MATIPLRKAGFIGVSRRLPQMPTHRHVADSAGGKFVPENVIPQEQTENPWSPHPETGVFGPTGEEGQGGHSATINGGTAVPSRLDSDIDQRAWFRSNVDVEVDKDASAAPTAPEPDDVAE